MPMTITLSHNDKFVVRDIYWCGISPLIANFYTLEQIAAEINEFGFQSKHENDSWKLVRRDGLVVFALRLSGKSGKLTIDHNPVATAFILTLVDRAHKEFAASYDDGQAVKPMLIGPEDLVARHPGTGLVFATKIMLALKLIGGIKLSSNVKKRSTNKAVHNFCG